jgi:hypothetical protein
MDGEDVFGRKITVGYPHKFLERDKKEGSPMKAQSGKKNTTFYVSGKAFRLDLKVNNPSVCPSNGFEVRRPIFLQMERPYSF